ncbi:MAG: hypothetical protein A2176_02380 [Spirochaetes bacterium RBG_13_51_14]|nr:MAG: hypothetical protein A2176_02380 [Spirochaetes bacterium RBG_13_51_14]
MKIKKIVTISIIAVCGYLLSPATPAVYGADKISFVIIFLGGPDTGAEGETIIRQFMGSLSKLSGMKKDSIQGKYFNNIADAKIYIQQNKNSYIMASIGFYLANRKSMNLSPLAVVQQQGNDREQYYCIVKKGAHTSLKQLKGKILAGNVLYEDKKFINTMIFDNKIDISNYFQLKPSNRPLSAIRKLAAGGYDAVLVNYREYYSLKNLDLFAKIQVIHESPKMPALGLMMIDTTANRAVKSKVVNAVTRMCGQPDTKEVCKTFAIDGFDTIDEETLSNEITKYESAR